MAPIFCIGIVSLSELISFGQKHFRFELSNWEFLVGLFSVLTVAALYAPEKSRQVASLIDGALRRLSAKRWHAVALAAAAPLLIGVATMGTRDSYPVPSVHDEFSYLLAGETFASGRLANPPFPVWVPFETFHVNQQPNYVSMYPPGQGLLLALGIVVFGHAWFGVLLSVVLLGAVSFWALEAWFPRRWALAGALATGVLAGFSYWMTSYWGGALAACGGALVTGAVRRLTVKPAAKNAMLFALGVIILANTRMYEGAVLSLASGVGLVFEWRRRHTGPDWGALLRRVVAPAAAVGALGLAWMGFYCWKTTGNPFELPYVQNLKTYHSRRLFVFENDRTGPQYRHEVMRRLYRDEFQLDRSDPERFEGLAQDAARHFGGSLLLVPLAMLPWLIRDRRIRHLLLIGLIATCFGLLPVWIRPHYLAPAMVAWIGVTVQALRYLQAIRIRGLRPGLLPARAVLATWILLGFARKSVAFTLIALGTAGVVQVDRLASTWTVSDEPEWARRRANLEKMLTQKGGKHLVLVRYAATHNVHDEWVYNHANWESTPVLWAREMEEDGNAKLAAAMPDRTLWILEADARPKPLLRPVVPVLVTSAQSQSAAGARRQN